MKAARLERVQAAYGIVQRRLERAVVDRTQELARRTRLIHLLGRIAEAAAAAETVCDMMRVGVDEIGAFLRWPVGHAYQVSQGWPGPLVSTDTWKIGASIAKAIQPFQRATRDVSSGRKSLIGRALDDRRALWVENLADRKIPFVRRAAAAQAGLESGIVLPVLAAGVPIAVLEFYTTAKTPADAAVLSALNQVASHIGQVAERVTARAAQRRSEAILSAVFANAVDPIVVIDEQGIVQSVNPAVERVFGFAPSDMIGRNVSMLMPPEIARRHDGYLRHYVRTGEAKIIGRGREVVARRKSGETFPADLAISEIDVDGQRLFAGTLVDLSERRSAEADLQTAHQRLADAIDHGGNSVSLCDADGRLVIFNDEFRRLVGRHLGPDLKPGLAFKDMVSRLAAGGFYGDKRGAAWVEERVRAFRALEPMNIETTDDSGKKRWGVVNLYRTRDGGTLVVYSDITALREAEEKAHVAQRRFGEAIDGLADGIALYGPDERLVMCNRSYREDLAFIGDVVKPGVTFEDILRGLSRTEIYDGTGEDWIKSRLAAFRTLKDTDIHFNSPQGRKWIRIRRFRAADGGTLLVRSDITAYRLAEEQARAAQQQLADAIESIADGIALFDRDEKLVMMNETYRRVWDLPDEIVRQRPRFEDLVRTRVAAGHYSMGRGEDVVQERVRQFRALETAEINVGAVGARRDIVTRHFRTRDGGTLLVRSDVTEQRRAEEQAQAAQRRLADAIEGMADGIALYDSNERLTLFNESYVRSFAEFADILKPGLTVEGLIRGLAERGFYADGSPDWIARRLRQFRALEPSEYTVRTADGERRVFVRCFRTRDGGTLVTRQDVTAIRQAEEQAMTAQQRLADAIEGISDGVALYDADERLVLFNRPYVVDMAAVADILKPGLGYETLIRALARSGYYGPVDEDAHVRERLARFRNLEEVEALTILPDGTKKWRQFRHYRTRDGGTLLVRIDITERKRIEAELESARRNLQIALDSMTGGVALFDKDERLVLFNENYTQRHGEIADVLKPGLAFPDLVAFLAKQQGGYVGQGKGWVEERIRKYRALEPVEAHYRDRAGDEKWSVSYHYRTHDGGTLLVRIDITERKHIEAELESARRNLQIALDSMTGGVALFDKDERLVLFNENYTQRHGKIADVLKPGLAFSDLVAFLAEQQGGYLDQGKGWVEARVRKYRALEPVEIHYRDRAGDEKWSISYHYRTHDGGTLLVRIDITERKRIEAELESARRNLQVALDSSSDGMALFDANERLVLCNESYRSTVPVRGDLFEPGMSFEEQTRRLMAAGRYPGKGEDWLQERLRRFRALEDTSFEAMSPSGPRQIALRHFRTKDGGTFLVRSDVTERVETEKRIAALQYRLTEAIDSVADGMMLFDDQERMVLANESYRNVFAAVPAALATGITFEGQLRILMAAGRYPGRNEAWLQERIRQFRALETAAHSIQTPEGTRHITVRHYRTRDGGTFMVRSDVTERREAEARALIQGQRLTDAVESIGDAIGLFDARENIVLFNEAYARLLGENADLLKPGASLESMVRGLARRGFYKDLPEDWAEKRVGSFRALETVEYRVQQPDGEHWMVSRHFRTKDGGTFMVITDITERMRAMQALERARTEAESANAAKTRFLSSMSHELRTPLNAILGFGQLLDMGQSRMPQEKRQEYTGIILKSGQHLLDLISQVLELSKIENQDIDIKSQTLTPSKMMRECLDMVWDEAKRRAVEIVDATCECGSEIQFRGDPLRVRQVLINLLSNAVKYNRQGGRVTVRCGEQDGMVRFDVSDTGSGIPLNRRDEVFRPFHRLGREAGTIEGSGIGLAIARELVQRMHGKIGFDSAPGEGSTFWFELPAAKREERV